MRQGKTVWIARVYTLEGHDRLDQLLQLLHGEEGIASVHAFRAIAGTGDAQEIHTSSLLTLSLRLPVIVEFIAEEAVVRQAVAKLEALGFKNIVLWPAEALGAQPAGGGQSGPHPQDADA